MVYPCSAKPFTPNALLCASSSAMHGAVAAAFTPAAGGTRALHRGRRYRCATRAAATSPGHSQCPREGVSSFGRTGLGVTGSNRVSIVKVGASLQEPPSETSDAGVRALCATFQAIGAGFRPLTLTPDPKPQTPDPKPQTPNPKPQIPNPKS